MLYEVAFVKKSTRTEEEEGIGPMLLWGPRAIAASSSKAAIAQAGTLAQADGAEKLDSSLLVVLVREFENTEEGDENRR